MHRGGQCFSPKTAFKPNPPSFWPEEKKAEANLSLRSFSFLHRCRLLVPNDFTFSWAACRLVFALVPLPRNESKARARVRVFFITPVWLSFRFLPLCLPFLAFSLHTHHVRFLISGPGLITRTVHASPRFSWMFVYRIHRITVRASI